MAAAQGILTSRGGMTSHAAVVARGMGRVCVAGASGITVNYNKEEFTTSNGDIVRAGDWISLDGTKGEVIKGKLKTISVDIHEEPDFQEFMEYVSDIKRIQVRTNADTPKDSAVAREYDAEGIGLCRTEHMFFLEDRIDHIRAMILADDYVGREKALARLLPMQRTDFYEIFKAMDGLPVTIRTLDPPLHEFLPHDHKDIEALARKFKLPTEQVKNRIDALKEQNPMLGLRGCRLGILYPEITKMQARAIFEAAAKALNEGIEVEPEIMIPLVGHEREFILQKQIVDEAARIVMEEKGTKFPYLVGTMIELPRAALVADKIVAAGAEFFSFGTNDLTQTTFGLSRDDSGSFLGAYQDLGIWKVDPFVSIDQEAVGQLISIGIFKGRAVDQHLKIGICGEHGGDPDSVKFCYKNGFNYVSCSPHRVPVARLAAAQAVIEEEQEDLVPSKAKKAAPKKAAKKTAKKLAKKPAKKVASSIKAKAPKRPATKKSPAKNKPLAVRKSAAKKTAITKAAAKKTSAKKTASTRKPVAKKTAARKPAAGRRPLAKKSTSSKKTAAGRRPRR
jgi:pyruvate,orthophosphate dikinase